MTVDTKSVVISASLYQSLGAIFRLVTEQVQDLDGSTAGLDGIVYLCYMLVQFQILCLLLYILCLALL